MGVVVVCDSSAGITRIRFAGRGRLALLSAWLTQAPRALDWSAGKYKAGEGLLSREL